MSFDKQMNDYRSQVLWRVKDCEELLKERVTGQEMRDSIRNLETTLRSKIEFDGKRADAKLTKMIEQCENRIMTAEAFTRDKHLESTGYIKEVDERVASMATREMIDQVYDAQKHLKNNFINEFASFQEYLKQQKTRDNKIEMRLRDIEL